MAVAMQNAAMKSKGWPVLVVGLAWLGMILCAIYAVAAEATGPVLVEAKFEAYPQLRSIRWDGLARIGVWGMLLVQLAVLWQLRGIGTVLLKQSGISAALAKAFRWFGHALALHSLLVLALPVPLIQKAPGAAWIVMERLPLPMLFASLIAMACAYIAARAMDESVRIKTENEGFI